MRLRNALALGVTAATTGTAVLALAVAPSSADPAPAPASGSGADAGTERTGPEVERGGPEAARLGDTSDPLAPAATPLTHRGGLLTPAAAPLNPHEDPTAAQVQSPGAGTGTGTGPAGQHTNKAPACGDATDPVFPLDTRIHGGPGTFVPGAGFRTFQVDLTNTTSVACHSVHPVLVLADRDRVLRPAQIQLDFYDSGASRWRPVQFEETEEDENIGVFNDFPGFAVPAGRTVTVTVRLAFHEDTAPNEIVANAAIVQRRGDDGDWVGESGDYRLTVASEEASGTDTGTSPSPVPSPVPDPVPPTGQTTRPSTPTRPELALTGAESTTVLAAASGAMLLSGAALAAAARRGRRRA